MVCEFKAPFPENAKSPLGGYGVTEAKGVCLKSRGR